MNLPASLVTRAARPNCISQLALAVILVALSAVLGMSGGCYNGSALVDEARSAAQRTRLAEVDLGTFETTMPKDHATKSVTELNLHLFGTVPRYRVPTVERQLKSEDYRLRHEMLAAVRQASADELAEPNLTQLRQRIEKVVNEILKDSPIEMVGFYSIRVTHR